MSYVATGSLDKEQEKALYVEPSELAKLDSQTRVDLLLRQDDIEARRTEAFWNAVSSAVAIALPVMAFFGIERWTRGK